MDLNNETFEFGQARLRLNQSLRCTPRIVGGRTTFMVEDEVTGRFFRLGVPQYTFLSMLDGQRTVSTALMKSATLLRRDAIDEQEAATLCKWAIESGLVESETGNSAERRQEQHSRQRTQQLMSWVNPLMLRIPLFNPDRIVETFHRYLGVLVSPLGLVIWLAVVVGGFIELARHWTRFYSNHVSAFSTDDLVWIAVAWVILKAAHELAHAIVCRHYGGRTHTCGILFLMMIPMPFVDLTSSWRFDNKWKRILTSAAGMMIELFLAGIACWIWSKSTPGPLQYHCGNLIVSATVITLLFNINPLMRFDGYYMLADLLEIPNLSGHGRQWLKGNFKYLYFGNKPGPLKETGYRGLCVRIYGVLAFVWSILVIAGLSLAAYSFIDGFGLLIAVGGSVLWFGIPVFRLLSYLVQGTKFETPNRLWFATASAITCLVAAAFLYLVPSPSVVSAPFVVDYDPYVTVRTKAPGFVEAIHVTEGQTVKAGQLLVTLSNPELHHELESLEIDIKISKLTIDTLFTQQQISQMQLEEESLAAMTKRQAELKLHVANLEVRSPKPGDVLADDLKSNLGKWFVPGQDLLGVGSSSQLIAKALTRQTDIEWLKADQSQQAELHIWGRHENEIVNGQIQRIHPRARDDIPHEAFAATTGGELDVVSRQQVESESEEALTDLMLTEPRVTVEISLSEAEKNSLYAGQRGRMLLRSRDENMLTFLRHKLIRFANESTSRTHGL